MLFISKSYANEKIEKCTNEIPQGKYEGLLLEAHTDALWNHYVYRFVDTAGSLDGCINVAESNENVLAMVNSAFEKKRTVMIEIDENSYITYIAFE